MRPPTAQPVAAADRRRAGSERVGTSRADRRRRRSIARGPAVRQLPAGVAGFTGRAEWLRRLDAVLAAVGRPAAVVISAIAGTAGVGKTALAVHWAHRAADKFPDGHLYVTLRGFDPAGTPGTVGSSAEVGGDQ